jgi:beta-mannosidase
MMLLDLDGSWKLKRTTENEWMDAQVPGSVFNDLLHAGKIEDPFYRDNEDQALDIASYDYEYQRDFELEDNLLAYDQLLL